MTVPLRGLAACAPGQSIGPNGTCAWAGSNPGASALLNATGEYAVSSSVCEQIESGALTLSNGASQEQLSNCANQGYSTPSAPVAPAPVAPLRTFISVPVSSSSSASTTPASSTHEVLENAGSGFSARPQPVYAPPVSHRPRSTRQQHAGVSGIYPWERY